MYIKNNIFYLILFLITFNFNSLYSNENKNGCTKLLSIELEFEAFRRKYNMKNFLLNHSVKIGFVYGYLKSKALAGDREAMFKLGYMYKRGIGVSKNYEEAAKWFRKAGTKGHREAQLELGSMYERGKGVPQDYKESLKWLKKAREKEFMISILRLIIKLKLTNAYKSIFSSSSD